MQQMKEVKTMSNKKGINKKKMKPLKKFFGGLYKVIDKIIVTPISTIVYKINKFAKKNS